MKRVLVAVAVMIAVAGVCNADISVNWSGGGGAYNNGGTWVGGPWPDFTGLRQLLWSSVDPTTLAPNPGTPNYLDPSGNEIQLTTYSAPSQDYCQWGVFGAGTWASNVIIGLNSGYLYSRIFQDPTPNAGDWYYQSTAIGPGLTLYDPTAPGTAIDFSSTPASPVELNQQVVPEPATWAIMGLGALFVFARRRFARA